MKSTTKRFSRYSYEIQKNLLMTFLRWFLVFYDYVENAVEKRAPFRAEHLALANKYKQEGHLMHGG